MWAGLDHTLGNVSILLMLHRQGKRARVSVEEGELLLVKVRRERLP